MISTVAILASSYLGNGIVITGDDIGHIFRSDIAYKTDERASNFPVPYSQLKINNSILTSDILSSEFNVANKFVKLDAAAKVPTAQLGGAGADATKYLRGDQTWAVISTLVITEEEFTSNISHLTTDASVGKAFTIANFPTYGIIKKLKVRADFTSGQQTAGSALVNNATGIAPADTSIAYDNVSGSFAIDDYIWIDNECMLVTIVGTPFTVTRAQKGTTAAYHDDNAQITKANNGLRLVVYKDSNKKEVERIIELNNLMTWKGVTDAAITAGDKLFGLTADIQNIDKDDIVYIDDTTPEEGIVQNVNHDVASATYDYTIFVKDVLATHAITKDIYKQIIYDIPTPYKSPTSTLYGTLFVDEKITATVNITLVITTDTYA